MKQIILHVDIITGRKNGQIIEVRLLPDGLAGIETESRRLVQPPFFRRDHDDAIARKRTPDRGRRRILQDGNAFHIIGIDIVDIPGIGKIVDDDQRIGIAEDRAAPPDGDRRLVGAGHEIFIEQYPTGQEGKWLEAAKSLQLTLRFPEN